MKRQKDDMQVNVAGFRRNIKNLAHNYSDAQIKVREATSNDPWGPSATIMAEIADLTYNVVAFSEIMQMIWKRLNDHGKNWRHVYKALILLEYLIKTGTEKVAQQCKENIFAIQTLKEFQHLEEGNDQGLRVRDKAKQLVGLLKDDERLKNERTKALKAKERFAQNASGFGSDGSIDGPTHRDSPSWRSDGAEAPPRTASEIEYVRPQTVGEEELQLQLAMAMSREEAEQEEAKRRSDDVRLQLALSQSEQDFKKGTEPERPKPQQSHLMDLLDISLGATTISSPPNDPWGMSSNSRPQTLNIKVETYDDDTPNVDPWSHTASPPLDPWADTTPKSSSISNVEGWLSRNQSTPSSNDAWLQNGASAATATNGNMNALPVDPWLSKPQPAVVDPWLSKSQPLGDPWQLNSNTSSMEQKSADPWAAPTIGSRPSPIGAQTSPNSDLDEFDIITNRSKSTPLNGSNNNNSSLLDDLDPLSTKKPQAKTPQSFLGENSSLVNLDNLIKPAVPSLGQQPQAAYNPFGDMPQQRTNLFQQQTQPVPSINQLKQSPFPSTLNQDPWAPVSSSNAANQNMNNNSSNNNNIAPWLKPEAAASNPFLS
ncbi:epsin-2 isoform X5 [Bradysia coprophila]|uniref:epsin-2 isoform X5 n=1 Tax=Bradysia coprophila TaxID=38358 RepID=UPI00187D9E48|nr:epsin-2 isoform X5 [Bradysia coprophila]